MLLTATPSPIVAPSDAADVPILYNELGSNTEVTNSIIGLNGSVIGTPSYLSGKNGNGISSPHGNLYAANFPIVTLPSVGGIGIWYTPLFNSGASPGSFPRIYACGTVAGLFQLLYDNSNNRFGLFFPGNGVSYFTSFAFTAGQHINFGLTWKNGGVTGFGSKVYVMFINNAEANIVLGGNISAFSLPLTVSDTFAVANESDGVSARGSEGACDSFKLYDIEKTDWSDQ